MFGYGVKGIYHSDWKFTLSISNYFALAFNAFFFNNIFSFKDIFGFSTGAVIGSFDYSVVFSDFGTSIWNSYPYL